MDILMYIDNLPEELLYEGAFCVTKPGSKKPYDPFLNKFISAKDQFYHIGELLEIDTSVYETLGYKLGSSVVSAIDIDGCVEDGRISDIGAEFINYMKSYTELSPSGTGIRILFIAENKFDRKKYKIKNSSINVEYYDSEDQRENGARMVRLTGNRIGKNPLRSVTTTDLLDKYMVRTYKHDGNHKITDAESNPFKVRLLGLMFNKDLSYYDFNYRYINFKSESEWDLIYANGISNYTNNLNEIKDIFEMTRYFKTKDDWHLKKWNRPYGEKIIRDARPDGRVNKALLEIAEGFDVYEPESLSDKEVNKELVVSLMISLNLTKLYYFRKNKYIKNWKLDYINQDIINHVWYIVENIKRLKKDYLIGWLESEQE